MSKFLDGAEKGAIIISLGTNVNHKNVIAIWTHGGLLSMQEAIWKGVPVIGMPFFLDQKYNVENLVAKGAGLRLDFKALSTQTVLNALEEIVYNKRYNI
ncbi:UDP-glucuronosyltransferase 2B11-like [Ooceraea biroi]|uniref:UDP-glucuronosyltransferase 2B11-like n=1 Tax=Ooceraea biroi TaxID=2015173 RepID=UPI000F088448|nr:UDP-glucuronosyltransferase 2B11-like [Ooceraea biroi]